MATRRGLSTDARELRDQMIARAYADDNDLRLVGKAFGVSKNVVVRALEAKGVPVRRRGRPAVPEAQEDPEFYAKLRRNYGARRAKEIIRAEAREGRR